MVTSSTWTCMSRMVTTGMTSPSTSRKTVLRRRISSAMGTMAWSNWTVMPMVTPVHRCWESTVARMATGAVTTARGVSVEVGERQAAVDIELIAHYGVAIADLAAGIRRNVIASVERMTGLEVSEVNVSMQDVYLESEDSTDDADNGDKGDKTPRVQ